jgi:hypothetical protein
MRSVLRTLGTVSVVVFLVSGLFDLMSDHVLNMFVDDLLAVGTFFVRAVYSYCSAPEDAEKLAVSS